jgi:hypothetical protein
LVGILTLLALAATAGALMVEQTTTDLVDHATVVITGKVLSVEPYYKDRGLDIICSNAKVKVESTVLGSTSDDVVIVRYYGGELDGTAFVVEDQPRLRPGDEVVLFLAPGDEGTYLCPDAVQSMRLVVDGTVLPEGQALTDYLAAVTAAAGH